MGFETFARARDVQGEGNDARDGTDTPQLTTEPTAPEPLEIKMEEVILSSWNSGDSPAETDIGDLAVDPTNPNLETYDWPGEYAQRFDGVDDTDGGVRPDETFTVIVVTDGQSADVTHEGYWL